MEQLLQDFKRISFSETTDFVAMILYETFKILQDSPQNKQWHNTVTKIVEQALFLISVL